MTVMIDDEVQAKFQAVAAPDEDFSAFLVAAAKDAISRRKREAEARAEAQAILNGPRRPHKEVMAEMRRKYNIPDLSHLSGEELIEDTERLIAAMSPEKRAAMEREGLL